MAQADRQLSALPRAVRYYKVQQPAFFARLLLIEQSLGVFREFENTDAVFEVGLVGHGVALDILQAPLLLRPPLGGHPVEELAIDPTVQFIHVHPVDSQLETTMLRLQPDNGLLMSALLVGVALAQCLPHPRQYFVVKGNPPEHVRELPLDGLLADIGFTAISAVTGAVVVDALLFFDFPDDGAAAVAAFDEARKGEVMLSAAMSLCLSPIEDGLHQVPQFSRHDGLVGAWVDAPIPRELTHIEARSQGFVNRARRDAGAALAERQTRRPRLLRRIFNGLGAVCVGLKESTNERRQLRVRLDDLT